ncbi:hypothetical protein SAMD00019534_101630, partial [Acytostelium subglobosum LB1]|uniref:hypothetical protein n=1 Tax=Acytostelium subglobosum LB1 TaxID=1410327 RepID=UPI000644F44C
YSTNISYQSINQEMDLGLEDDDQQIKNLRTGDLVTFYSDQDEEEGFLSKTADSAVILPNKSKECVFKIHPMTHYTARKALKKKAKRIGGVAGAGASSPAINASSVVGADQDQEKDADLKQLEEYQDMEEVTNEATMIQLEGRDLVYGQIIQLFHQKSNQFLFAKQYNAKHTVVGFRSGGNQKCYFKIAPSRSFSRMDGSKVQHSDLVQLRHEKSGLYLRITNFCNEKGMFEVILSEQGTLWKMSLSDVEGKVGINVAKANEPLRFFHREGGYVNANEEDSNTTFTYKTKTPSSVKTLFEIELDHSSNIPTKSMFLSTKNLFSSLATSNDITFGQHFKIRLFGTKNYLSLGRGFVSNEVPTITVNGMSASSNSVPVADSASDPNYQDDIPLILVPESEKNTPNATFYFVPKEQTNTEHVTYNSFSQKEDYKYITSRIQRINSYLAPMQELRKKISLQELRSTLIDMIKFCTQSDVEDPLEREGTPIKTHQSLLASSYNLSVLLDLLKKFFNPLDPLTISYIYRIFKQICKSNVKNGIAINKHIKTIAGPPEIREKAISFGLGSILLDIYKNNNILLENLTEDKVIEFIDDIRLTKDPRYLELLSELCVCNGKPIVKNQQYLCDLLLERNSDLLLRTKVGTTVEVEVAPGRWMSMPEFMSKGDEKTQRYFEQSLSLYANISRGRNYNGIRLINQCCSFQECFLCLKDDSLPYMLRGSYTNVVIHVIMDCYPQKPYAKINYIWNPLVVSEADSHPSTIGRNTHKSSDGLAPSTNNMSSPVGTGHFSSSSSSAGPNDDEIFTTFAPVPETIHIGDPSNISQFLMNYVLRPENFTWNAMYSSQPALQRPQWGFFHKILIAVNYAFKFGFFKRKERILLNRLRDILEYQSNDAMPTASQVDLGRTIGGSRLLEDDSTVLVAIKIEILQILHTMLSLQKKTTFENFLRDMSSNEQSDSSHEGVKLLIVNKLNDMRPGTMITQNKFIITLFDLLKHENNTLSSLVLSMLVRVYRYQGNALLVNPTKKLLIISNSPQSQLYEKSMKKMEEMTKYCSNPLSLVDTEEVLKILAYFVHMCESGDAKAQKNQTMLKVMGIHQRIIGVLKMGCSLERLFDERGEVCHYLQTSSSKVNNTLATSDGSSSNLGSLVSTSGSLGNGESQRIQQQSCFVAKIFRSCYEFLRTFCKNNADNQAVLYGYIEFLIGHLIRYGNIFGTIETLMEIFKNNIKLCVQFGESPYMKLLIEFIIHQDIKEVDPYSLKFLNMIMKPTGLNAVTEIQISISKIIKQYRVIIANWLLPFSTLKEVMREPKGATISKFHKSNNSSAYKLHACLQEVLVHSLQNEQDGAEHLSSTKTSNNNNNNNNPKLIRSTAKHMLITSEEVLPREFVINLELVWLLTVCSFGRNTPTEIICSEFISMYDCFEVLVVRTDGAGRENSSLMIHDTKEYLDHNLQFRFKSAYINFLHEVYFNSDTLKGDLLALQLNENLWNLVDQFTNQLKFLFTSYSTNRLSLDYFTSIARYIVLPMVAILERFYSQCFYFDKATQKHLMYSSVLMGNLLKFYSYDDALSIPRNQANNSTKKITLVTDDDPGSSGGIHPIFVDLRLDEKISLLVSLVKCLKAMDRSAIAPASTPGISVASVSEVIKGCEEITTRLDYQNSRWTRQRAETDDVSVTMLSKQSSIFLSDKKEHPLVTRVKERGYQQMAIIAMSSADDGNSNSSSSINSNSDNSNNGFLEILVFQLRNSLFDNNELKLHCLNILLSALKNNSGSKRELQIKLTEMYCHSACIGLIGSKSNELAIGALNLLHKLLEEQYDETNPLANNVVKEAIHSFFTSSPDIQFFKNLYLMMDRAKSNLRDTTRNIRLESIKHNISGNLVIEHQNTTIGLVHKHADLDMNVDPNPYATEFMMMNNIFTVLQLLCQGSSNMFKSYIRCQPDNYKSFDLLRELCLFLKVLESIVDIDFESIKLATHYFSCLKEIVKHTPENQIAVTNIQMCKPICNILRKNVPPRLEEKFMNLKIVIIDFLLHVIDREDPRVVSRMIELLDYSVIEENTKMVTAKTSTTFDNESQSIKLASMSFRLIKILADNDKSQNPTLAKHLLACGEHCKSRIGRVEMFNNSKLERIYFPIPSSCRRLILQAKEQTKIRSDENQLQEDLQDFFIANGINWNKTGEKLESFMEWSEYKLIEIEHHYQLKLQPLLYFVVKNYNKWALTNFAFALVINVLLIVYATSGSTNFEETNHPISYIYRRSVYVATMFPLSILQTVFSILTSVSFYIKYGSVILYKGWIKYLNNGNSFMLRGNNERMHHIRAKYPLHKYLYINFLHLITDAESVYFFFSIIFSLLGLYNPLFYAFHILQITLKTKALRIVIRAININKGTLLLMGCFMIQSTYLMSIFSYAFFSQYYYNYNTDTFFCTTLYQCFLGNVFYGVPTSGQLVQFVKFQFDNPNTNAGTGLLLAWTVFCVIFYVVTTIFLLNVILGIIVDTFGQIRDQRSITEEYKANYCFICSIDRETFQKKGIDFNKHVEDDHNKWYYLYFFAYLKERMHNNQQNQLSDSELNALERIESNSSLSLFPIESAISLQQDMVNDNKLQDIEAKITSSVTSQINPTLAMLLEEVKNLRQQVNDLSN